jgi:succinate dehydrogenase / fumarate reductase cytochrome b subunit
MSAHRPTAFLLHRLHALSGLVPVGLFVILHLFTNFQLLVGDFQHEVDFIHDLPALLWLEVTLWLSIAFHAGLGLYYTFSGNRPNAVRYAWGDNWRYLLQRVSGVVALLFILLHVATLRWQWALGDWFTPFVVRGPEGEPLAAASTALALQHAWWVPVLYAVGVASVVYHWANGLWSAGITWGFTVSRAAQRRWGQVCAGIGLALAIFGGGAIAGALRHEVRAEERAGIETAVSGEGEAVTGEEQE